MNVEMPQTICISTLVPAQLIRPALKSKVQFTQCCISEVFSVPIIHRVYLQTIAVIIIKCQNESMINGQS